MSEVHEDDDGGGTMTTITTTTTTTATMTTKTTTKSRALRLSLHYSCENITLPPKSHTTGESYFIVWLT